MRHGERSGSQIPSTTANPRADTKAAVLLGFTGAVLGVFITVTRSADGGQFPDAWRPHALWWAAVISALPAIVCLVCAIAPRRRGGRHHSTVAPGYFEHITPEVGGERLSRAFERVGHDPTGPLLSSLARTREREEHEASDCLDGHVPPQPVRDLHRS